MERPKATQGDYTVLPVVSLNSFGAFLDCGGDKDLLLPVSEQTEELQIGDEIIVAVVEDNQGRLFASMRLESYIPKNVHEFKEGDEVDLLIYRRTDLGFKAIINKKAIGVIYGDQVFKPIRYADQLKGYILKLRSDGKIDLALQKTGHLAAEEIGPKILSLLSEQNGFLNLNEKTPPETIYKLFGVSKKKYKIILGGLYKKKLITIHDDGIRLVDHKLKSTT